MERFCYWLDMAERLGGANGMGERKAGMETKSRLAKIERESYFWGGRELSPEAYLAVPTFLRRGLRPRA